ncbi:MAG TPA: hypothetical protein VF287_04295 [Usitatibacter sp.]
MIPRIRRGPSGQVGTSVCGQVHTLENFRYSPALKRSGITWTPQALDGYIADPQNAVPANRMPYAGMPDARDRADVISYLQNAFK